MAVVRLLLVPTGIAMAIAMCACLGTLAPAVHAAGVEQRQCVPPSQPDDALTAIRLLSVESYCHVDFCSGAGQLYGVRLLIAPPPGASPDEVARKLQCHGARAVLAAPELRSPNDPYWLPDSWVYIEVKPRGAQFEVILSGESIADNLRIMRRAKAFASAVVASQAGP